MTQRQAIRCDECGREVSKLTRRRQGHGYCATCYARVFKRSLCPRCGEIARLPHDDPKATCRRCESDKPCTRCGRTEYKVGKITPYGPVCNACAPHFRESEPCEACGEPSRRLTRANRLNHDHRLCPACATADHGTCSACRRHRLLVITPEGNKYCHTCHEQGDIFCPTCGTTMPAGRGKSCEACYWSKTCRKRLMINQAAFTEPEMSRVFEVFGEWLMCTVGPKKAALKINHYLTFFLNIETIWQQVPSYSQLLNHFGAEGLRRVRLPMRWLHEVKGVESDPKAKRLDSDKRRVRECLSSFPTTSRSEKALHDYWGQLEPRVRSGKTSYTSARLALRAAASLLRNTDPMGQRLPAQRDVDDYLDATPGQAATLTGFTNFLNRQHGTALKPMTDTMRTSKRRKEKLARALMEMAKQPHKDSAWMSRWTVLAMEYFHGRQIAQKTLHQQDIEASGNGIWVTLEGLRYWLPII